MKTGLIAGAALALVLAAACGRDEEAVGPALTGSDVLAVINGQVVREDEFQAFLSYQEDSDLEVEPSLRKVRFIEFVTEQLILQEASAAGVRIEDRQVEAQLQSWLAQVQEMPPGFEERIRNLLTVQEFMKQTIAPSVEVTNEEVYGYYGSHAQEYMVNDQAHVLEILVPERATAEDLLRQAQPGDIRAFRSLARTYSQGLTADSGGDLGIFERGQLPENFEQVIFKLAPGQISSVFQSQQGYHIFMMEEWVPRHAQKYYEVQEHIFEKLTAEKERKALKEYVDRLFAKASIEVHDPDLALEQSDVHTNLR